MAAFITTSQYRPKFTSSPDVDPDPELCHISNDYFSYIDSLDDNKSELTHPLKVINDKYESESGYHGGENFHDVKIPKIIMQTWKDTNIPDKWKESPRSIQKFMPDWKYVFMTDQDNRDFVQKHFPDFLPYYDSFPYPIQRADAIRACWLYVHGGIYMDLDYIMKKSLNEWFVTDNEVFVVQSGNVGSIATNSIMASKPGCKLWLAYIEEMKKPLPYWAYGKHLTVMSSTGPICFSRSLRLWGGVYAVLPSKYVMPCSLCESTCDTEEGYLIPLNSGSWNSWDSIFFNAWLCNWKKYVIIIIILVILIILFIIWIIYRRQ